jgi:hypothetical protein
VFHNFSILQIVQYPDDYESKSSSNVDEFGEALTAPPSPFDSRPVSPLRNSKFYPEQFEEFKLDFPERNKAVGWVIFGVWWVKFSLFIFKSIITPVLLSNKFDHQSAGTWWVTRFHHLATAEHGLLNCTWKANKYSKLDNGSNLQEST